MTTNWCKTTIKKKSPQIDTTTTKGHKMNTMKHKTARDTASPKGQKLHKNARQLKNKQQMKQKMENEN